MVFHSSSVKLEFNGLPFDHRNVISPECTIFADLYLFVLMLIHERLNSIFFMCGH